MTHGTHNAESDLRNQNIKIYINGEFFQRQDAKISVFDSGYLVGDGVWEGIRLYKGKLAFVNDHLSRLWTAAKAIGLNIPYSQDEIIKRIQSTVEINNMFDQVHIRVMLTRGIKKTPSQDPRLTISGPNLVIIAEHKKASIESKNKGTISGIKESLSSISDDESILLIWSDLILESPIKLKSKIPTIITTSSFTCRWSIQSGKMREIPTNKNGIAGIYYFNNKKQLESIPKSGSFEDWFVKNILEYNYLDFEGIRELGDFKMLRTRMIKLIQVDILTKLK